MIFKIFHILKKIFSQEPRQAIDVNEIIEGCLKMGRSP